MLPFALDKRLHISEVKYSLNKLKHSRGQYPLLKPLELATDATITLISCVHVILNETGHVGSRDRKRGWTIDLRCSKQNGSAITKAKTKQKTNKQTNKST